MSQIIPARVVVSEHQTYGLQVRIEVQIPGTSLWRPVKAASFKEPKGGEIIPFLSIDGLSLKRFVASLEAEPVSAARVDSESDI